MSESHRLTAADFRAFFLERLRHLSPENELIWMSNTVDVEAIKAAYPLGVFPWPGEDPNLFPWVAPLRRGVLPLKNFRLGRSTRRDLSRRAFHVTFNQAFSDVILACHRMHEPESWIHPAMRQAYTRAFHENKAWSVEVWNPGNKLVGGLYGVDSGTFFSGESMFHHEPNAGKAAVRALIERLRERGDAFLDIQQLTPHMRAMGAEEWDRATFQRHIGLRT